jgi:hypothetical protein
MNRDRRDVTRDANGDIPATLANMRQHYARGVFAWSPATDERYSADPADYWHAPPTLLLRDTYGAPMILARDAGTVAL